MKVTLQVDGREPSLQETFKPIRGPQEGVLFEINSDGIDQSLFQVKKEDPKQEAMRQLILEAFTKKNENPEKYGKPFKTLMPKKNWDWKTVGELKELAAKLGDHMADWVEQAIEWAQRIQNGETWEAICNEPDTAQWARLIQWKDGSYQVVGGSCMEYDCCYDYPAFYVYYYYCFLNDSICNTVPLVVLYKQYCSLYLPRGRYKQKTRGEKL